MYMCVCVFTCVHRASPVMHFTFVSSIKCL